MKNKYLTWPILCLSFLVLSSCGETASKDKEDELGGEVTYSLDYPMHMEFTRGVEASYPIKGSLPGDNNLNVRIDGLPSGASFSDGVLTWTPSCELDLDNGKFSLGAQLYYLRITFDSPQTGNVLQVPSTIVVFYSGPESPCEDSPK